MVHSDDPDVHIYDILHCGAVSAATVHATGTAFGYTIHKGKFIEGNKVDIQKGI